MEAITHSLLMVDPPDHTRLRNLVTRAFTPRRIERLRGRIQTMTDDLLDAAEARGDFDFIRDLAYPLPVMVIAELLGAPTGDRERFKRWSDDIAVILDPITTDVPMTQVDASYGEAAAYLRRLFAARREEPRDDLISALVAAEADGDRLSEIELVAICMLLLGAGHETTTNLLGNGVLALLRHPEQRERLQAEPGLVEDAVEELLRYDSPVQITDRVATEDLELHGHRIRSGQVVGLILGAANRDPDQFSDPDCLDLGRTDNRHLAFGHGIHFCLGAALARLEAQIVLRTFLDRFPRFTGDPNQTDYKRSMVLRGLQSFPLRLQG
jgi:cytochrome P450